MVSSEGRNNRETKSGIARKMAAGLEKKVVRKAKNLDWQIFPLNACATYRNRTARSGCPT